MFTDQVFKEIMDEYISNLKLMEKTDIVDVSFKPVKDIRLELEDFNDSSTPWWVEGSEHEKFKESLLNGHYWAIGLKGGRVVLGKHRIYLFRELIKEGRLPEDFEVLCITPLKDGKYKFTMPVFNKFIRDNSEEWDVRGVALSANNSDSSQEGTNSFEAVMALCHMPKAIGDDMIKYNFAPRIEINKKGVAFA